MNIQAPRGTVDLLPEQLVLRHRFEQAARGVFRRFNYREIRTPIFEDTQLFTRSIGEATDIVEKEMYTIPGSDEDSSVTLRPEGTAGIVRAYVEKNIARSRAFQKYFYIGPMFRYERPQAGRLRQFHQVGVEILGATAPFADAEAIMVAATVLQEFGLRDFEIMVNSIGDPESRDAYRAVLKRALAGQLDRLCENCRRRMERNVFRVLDCKNPQCKVVCDALPPIRDSLTPACLEHFKQLLDLLAAAGVPFTVDRHLVRGLDYYTKTVFEICHHALGARSAVCGGGRYDNLVEEIGGPSTGCVGFAIGMEPTELALANSRGEEAMPATEPVDYYVVAFDDTCREFCFRLMNTLRSAGKTADMDFEIRSMKAQLRQAGRLPARKAVIVGPDEMKSDQLMVKDLAEGTQETVGRKAFLKSLGVDV